MLVSTGRGAGSVVVPDGACGAATEVTTTVSLAEKTTVSTTCGASCSAGGSSGVAPVGAAAVGALPERRRSRGSPRPPGLPATGVTDVPAIVRATGPTNGSCSAIASSSTGGADASAGTSSADGDGDGTTGATGVSAETSSAVGDGSTTSVDGAGEGLLSFSASTPACWSACTGVRSSPTGVGTTSLAGDGSTTGVTDGTTAAAAR